MTFSIRSALLAVAVLGLVTCGLALVALAKPLAAANTGRIERGGDAVEAEVRRLHVAGSEPGPGATTRRGTSRSGFVSAGDSFEAFGLPWEEAPDVLRGLIATSKRTNALVSSHHDITEGVLFAAVEPIGYAGRYAWAVSVMSAPHGIPVLRVVGIALDLVALGLAVAAMFAVLVVRRGADALTRSLAVLGRDLSSPVPRSRVTELNFIADGIAVLARDLAHTQNQLAERERIAVLGRVTAGVAHELRNPLAVMKLRIDLMRRNPKVPVEIAPELDVVVEEVVRLDRLVNDLLTVAGRRLSEQRSLEIGELVRHRGALMSQLAAEKQIVITISGSVTARVDPDAIARVIDNVLKNAIEASPPGAEVRIDVSSDDRGACMRCIDHGAGVPADREDELFEPFFTTKPEGVGLGLALSRAIAAAHGGTLTYMRESDSTVFELRLVGAA